MSGKVNIKKPSLLSLFSSDFTNLTLNAMLKEGDKNIVDVSILEDEQRDDHSITSFFIRDFPVERISSSYSNTFLSMTLAGVTNFSTLIDGEGSIEVRQEIDNGVVGNIHVSINDEEISFYDGFIERGNYSASNISLILPFNGSVEASVDLLHKKLINMEREKYQDKYIATNTNNKKG